MTKTASLLTALFAFSAGAQDVDSSANASLRGAYFVRQVLLANFNQNTGAVTRAVNITGTMTFDGAGKYSFSGSKMDSRVGSSSAPFSTSGTYSVGANGIARIQSPFDNSDTEYGGVGAIGPSAIVASATEGPYNDIFVAIPISASASNSSVQGTYKVGFIDFLQASASAVRDGYYTLTSTGNGSFGNVSVTGAMANQGSSSVTQSYSGVTYAFNSGAGTMTFPASATPLTTLVSGQKAMYVSNDGNILLGGDPNGFDIAVGLKALSGSASNSTFQGTYYAAALENDASDLANGNSSPDSFYGSLLSLGEGDMIYHERLTFFDFAASDFTGDYQYSLNSAGTGNDGFLQTIAGAGGQGTLQIGVDSFYSLTVAFQAKQYAGLDVFIDPLKVFNAANFAPITNPVSPGEYVSIFGQGLSGVNLSAQSFPLPTTLGGVQVLINGRPAPLKFVSPAQINLLIPNATTEAYATFQVVNNGTSSNKVTLYTNFSSPGVFALTSNGGSFPPGLGPAAILHADYSLVTPSNPAKAGETLQLYVTGLGSVTPSVADGASAPSSPLSTVDENIGVTIIDNNGNTADAQVSFQGLAPGFAGLYQVNFVVPSGLASGLGEIILISEDGSAAQAKLYVK